MSEDRLWQDIIAHLLLACTGVGLIAMGINKYNTNQFFFNKTARQTILSDISTAYDYVTIPLC